MEAAARSVLDGEIALVGGDTELDAVSVTPAGSPAANCSVDVSELPEAAGIGKAPTLVGTFPEFVDIGIV